MQAQPGSLNTAFGNNGFRLDYVPGSTSDPVTVEDIMMNDNADTYTTIRMAGGIGIYKRSGDGFALPQYGNKGFSDCFNFGGRAHFLQPDGSVLFAGFNQIEPGFGVDYYTSDFVLGKLNPQGKWDNNFGDKGIKKIFPIRNSIQPQYITKLPNGKLMVIFHQQEYLQSRLFVLTLSASGDYDPALPNYGMFELPVGQESVQLFLVAISRQPDGKFLIALNDNPSDGGPYKKLLIRLNADGTQDNSFGNAGVQNLNGFLSGDKISAAGFRKYGGYCVITSTHNDDAPLRFSLLKQNGTPDFAVSNWTKLVSLPFTGAVSKGVTDEDGRFSLLMSYPVQGRIVRLTPSGNPDPQFNLTGWLQLDQYPDNYYYDIALTPRKNLMITGSGTTGINFVLGKINPSGVPDRYYDQDGFVTVNLPFQPSRWTSCIKLGETGVLVGQIIFNGGQPKYLIKAINTAGGDIKTFANNGTLTIPMDQYNAGIDPAGTSHFLFWRLQGSSTAADPSILHIRKYTNAGQLQNTWGTNGDVQVQLPPLSRDVQLRVLRDNRILIGFAYEKEYNTGLNGRDVQAWCLRADGSRDWNFGTGGFTNIDLETFYDDMHLLRQQRDGKIIVVTLSITESSRRLGITRLLENGKPDPAYQQGIKPIATGTVEFNPLGALVQSDNSLFIAGVNGYDAGYHTSAALLKFNSNGTRATGFANQGLFQATLTNEQASGIDINEDHGKLLFTCLDRALYENEMVNLRLLPNGTIDNSFGTNGKSAVSFASGRESITDTKLFSNQLIMIGHAALQTYTAMLASITLEGYSALREATPGTPPVHTFRIYPNPATSWIQIQSSAQHNEQPSSAELFDTEGRLVQSWRDGWDGTPRRSLWIGNLPSGNYLIRVNLRNGESHQEKMVIMH
ncbi:hypothetical protein FPE01S_02_03160 [Flavihumibacter petaseus NBRC 106054]|uniref:Secretion system C-terminal sorting domain-containing protein n=1 Tax=Flavihumibacter petaseus NBRC 106054 TaxID=1220578 RepID=A0A0E9MZN0_9BACT|nr:hypothetical protein FPE01S_02_03160 [Flavihumibacter petaseus NBRC 106054]